MRSWDDLMRYPAPAYLMTCPEGCGWKKSGNNHRLLKSLLQRHIRETHTK